MRRCLCVLFLVSAFVSVAPVPAQTTSGVASPADTYAGVAGRIIEAALADSFAWNRLAYLADTFGPRLSGTDNLENAIDWVLEEMKRDGLDNVRGEAVMVPHWVRGEESLTLLAPRRAGMQILGLGGSIATPPEGITADALVVGSFDELEARRQEAAGKIVVYDAPFTSYGQTVQYRVDGAVRAARAGAVASLVRSVGPVSLYTPHTGMMRYQEGVPQIPHAAVTVEDAMMMHRMQQQGHPVRLHLYMEARTLPDAPSRNVVAEITGREKPEEVVVLGGHIDSWDVGQGALDDGGGCVAAWQALRLLKALDLRPRRTVRVVLWTNEENGLRGGTGYRETHADEMDNHVLAIESDAGVFKPTGVGFSGIEEALLIIQEIAKLLERIGAGAVAQGGGGADISPMIRLGVPGMNPMVENSRYFWYHHTHADTVDKVDARDLNLNAAVMAVMAYVVADLPVRLPRAYIPATN